MVLFYDFLFMKSTEVKADTLSYLKTLQRGFHNEFS